MNMPPTPVKHKRCSHTDLQLEPSAYATEAGFVWSSPKQRFAATTKTGRAPTTTSRGTRNADAFQQNNHQPSTFPGPLVLPWDDLGWDPDHEGQTFKSWYEEPYRNKPTTARKTLYVFDVPEITEDVKFMDAWTQPQLPVTEKNGPKKNAEPVSTARTTPAPQAQDIVAYLSAFYHGLPTKLSPQQLRFVPWGEKPKTSKKKQPQPKQQPEQQQYIGLSTPTNLTTRIRARPSPDNVFSGQLNLEDILDFVISTLPRDAYAVVLLTHHDLYEDEADDFCCGRAYGGSRVCVVSMARYRPELDASLALDRDHMWPASHCRAYVEQLCAKDDIHVATRDVPAMKGSPMREAVRAASTLSHENTPASLTGLWFSRVVRTVSHELGHCLALGHCIYYACLMQSTAGVREDVRQPPYLCPVCVGKVAWMVAVEVRKGGEEGRKEYVRERYEALQGVCGRWEGVGMFAGYKAWLGARVREVEG